MANVSTPNLQTDWNKCCLCQCTTKNEDLKSPTLESTGNDGYTMIATNVPLFKAVNQLPLMLVPDRLDEGNGIETTLRLNKARYHQSCRLLFNNSKLERARKRTADIPETSGVGQSKVRRTSLDSEKCFLCNAEEPKTDIRCAMTMEFDQRLNECARNLKDGKLLALLSGGDAVALELKYHKSCLTTLYNRERDYLSAKEKDRQGESREKSIQPLVFSELLAYIVETKVNSDVPVIFKLSELTSLYKERLRQFGIDDSGVHPTRLKERILAEIPELESYKCGRNINIVFKKDISTAISQASTFSEAMILSKAANILRRKMIDYETKFDGNFHEDCVKEAFPPSLLQFVCMIEHGIDIKSQLKFGASKTDLAMAQLLQYNCYGTHREGASTYRHSKERETPFPIYLGMAVYSKTRKRALVELLHGHGLSISYDRVLELSAQLGEAAIERFKEEHVVCPSVLRKGLFTTAAMDNIDHNPTSTTATTSFHGTSISLFQHPTAENHGEEREPLVIGQRRVLRVPDLPESFTNIHPAILKNKKPLPTQTDLQMYKDIDALTLDNEFEWLKEVALTQRADDNVDITWSSYHASKKRNKEFEISISSLLPLFREPAHSVATIRHVMDKIKETVSYLSPGQVPIITADQPIYTIAKQIQWYWPNEYGEDKLVVMFGGLHIEMAALKSIGSFLQSSGWTSAIAEAEIASSGTADSFLSASSVTKTRHAHQITACSLFKLLNYSYQCYQADRDDQTQQPTLDFEEWCEMRKKESPQFCYWYVVLTMELTILSFIRANREADFALYQQAVASLIPFFFANNNVNYARWLPIHLRDMGSLKVKHPQIYEEFKAGKFVVFKSKRPFSSIAIDHAHEQANAVIKGEGGVIGVTEDPSALRRWMVAGPEVSRLIAEYETFSEEKTCINDDARHLEQTPKAQRTFLEKVDRLYSVLYEMGNPFQEESTELLALDTKVVASANAAQQVLLHHKNGQDRFHEFMKSLEKENGRSLYEPIKKNKLGFFEEKRDPSAVSMRQKIMKDDYKLFSKLFISCQSRECDLLDFFRHENQPFPAALSDSGKLHSCVKAHLASILEERTTSLDKHPDASAIIIDGSALINALPPRSSKTFGEYAMLDVIPKIHAFCAIYNRIDIVFDVYLQDSLKAETRIKRGKGSRRRVTEKGKLPSNWKGFMRDDSNKKDLFQFLAIKVTENCSQNVVFVTREENVLCSQDVFLGDLAPCNHEEADTRLFVHAKHAVEAGHTQVVVKANDTDVIVIAVNVFQALKDLGLEEMWIEFGQGTNIRWIPIYGIVQNIGEEKAMGMPFFHAFTGCDTVSAFRGKGKKAAWQTWNVCPEISNLFKKLSRFPPVFESEDQAILEQFVITMYDRSSSSSEIDAVRLDMFARKQRSFDTIPPTQAALVEHAKRAIYQSGCIWSQSTVRQMDIVNPSNWGWCKTEGIWRTIWTKLPPIAESCKELTKCGCKTDCTGRCKCYRSGLSCTELCSCKCDT